MIQSWRNALTRKVWDGKQPNQFRGVDLEAAIDLLLALNVAKSLNDLSPLASVGLHKLKGDREDQWAMTINGPWHICFEFRDGNAYLLTVRSFFWPLFGIDGLRMQNSGSLPPRGFNLTVLEGMQGQKQIR